MRKLVVSLLAALALVAGMLAPLALAAPAQAATGASQERFQPVVLKMNKPKPKVRHSPVWNRLAKCESGGRWGINTGNGYYGGLQISPSTWRAFGGKRFAGLPHRASKSEQIVVAKRIKNGQGWGAWPSCSRKIGVR